MTTQPCPACGDQIKPPRASYSRYVNIYICAECGKREAIQGFFWSKKYNKEKPKQPEGYNPWGS